MINSQDTLTQIRFQRHVKLIYLFSIVGTIASFSFGIIHFISDQNIILGVIEVSASCIALLNLMYLHQTHNERVASSIVLLIMYMVLISILSYGGYQLTGIIWFSTFPALAYGMKNHQEGHGWLTSLVGGIILHTILGSLQLIPAVYTIPQIIQLIISIFALTCLIVTRKYYTEKDESQLAQQLEEISTMNTILEKEQEKESKLQNELFRFKLAFDRAYDFMTITDNTGKILYVNDSAERITGYTKNEIIGTKAGKLWGNQMPTQYYQKMWYTIKDAKKEFISELKNKHKNGQIYDAKITITPVSTIADEVDFFIGIERDITKEKELEKAKAEFLSFAAHQLRTPVTAIKWYIQMLQDGTAGALTPQQKNIAEKIELTNQRMNELMHEFLNISRLESGRLTIQPQTINLRDFCDNLQQELNPLLQAKQIKLDIKCEPDPREITVDESLFRQIIINYLTNAIKYTPPGRTVTIIAQPTTEGVKIAVQDKGIGIPLIDQPNLFSKFFRAENARLTHAEGSGLGLYFIKKIVDVAGGRVGFESKVGEGSTFYVVVPLDGWKSHEGVISIGEQEV